MTNTQKHKYLLTFDAGNYGDVIRILRAEADSLEFASTCMDIEFADCAATDGPFVDQPFTDGHLGSPQPVVDPGLKAQAGGDYRNAIVGTWVIADGVSIEQTDEPTT